MDLSEKLIEILKRKKQALKERLGSTLSNAAIAQEFEVYLKMAQANVPPKYWDHQIDDLDKANAQVKKIVVSYCADLPNVVQNGQGLFLVGSNGTGKTLTASLILKAAVRAGYTARFTSLNEIMSCVTDGTYNPEARAAFRKEILEVDFLVIDDITKTYKNTEKQTSTFVDLQFDNVFRTRANLNLPVIITSNHKREEALKSVDEVITRSLLSLFNEHLRDVIFFGEDRRASND